MKQTLLRIEIPNEEVVRVVHDPFMVSRGPYSVEQRLGTREESHGKRFHILDRYGLEENAFKRATSEFFRMTGKQ